MDPRIDGERFQSISLAGSGRTTASSGLTLAAWAALLVLPVLGVGLLHGFAYARAYPSSLMAELLGVESADGVQRGLLTLEQMFFCW